MEIQENEYVVTLVSLKQGAAVELFDAELKKVLNNIIDLNTEAKAKREITLKVSLKPTEDRGKCDVEIKITSKMASAKPAEAAVYLGKVEGELVAVEHDPNQGKLFDKPRTGNVKTFDKGAS